MPSFDAGRVVEHLTHVRRLVVAVHDFIARPVELAGQPQHSGHQLGGALDLGVADVLRLEEFGVEQHPQHGADIVFAIEVGLDQGLDGLGVARLGVWPLRYRRLIGHEETVYVPGNEPGGGRLLADNIDDVLSVEVARLAEEGLLAVVVVIGMKLEVPRDSSVGPVGVPL